MNIQMITIISILLSVVSPVVFWYALRMGIKNAKFGEHVEKNLIRLLSMSMIIWVAIVFGLTHYNAFAYVEGDLIPMFLLALLVPTTLMGLFMLNNRFRIILDHVPLFLLTGGQFFRIFGTVFFLVAITGIGPKAFMSSGYGDLLTGILAITAGYMLDKKHQGAIKAVWVFSIVGMLDLVNVSYILLANYPIWSRALPSTASAGEFPLILIVGITAPIALMLHVYAIRLLLKSSRIEVVSQANEASIQNSLQTH